MLFSKSRPDENESLECRKKEKDFNERKKKKI